MSVMRTTMAALFAFVLALGPTMTPPAEAQVQNGLVNIAVNIDDVVDIDKVAIGVAANIAANVCGVGVQVGVVAQQLARGGPFSCTNTVTGDSVNITQ